MSRVIGTLIIALAVFLAPRGWDSGWRQMELECQRQRASCCCRLAQLDRDYVPKVLAGATKARNAWHDENMLVALRELRALEGDFPALDEHIEALIGALKAQIATFPRVVRLDSFTHLEVALADARHAAFLTVSRCEGTVP